jgi:hypothetical protein
MVTRDSKGRFVKETTSFIGNINYWDKIWRIVILLLVLYPWILIIYNNISWFKELLRTLNCVIIPSLETCLQQPKTKF